MNQARVNYLGLTPGQALATAAVYTPLEMVNSAFTFGTVVVADEYGSTIPDFFEAVDEWYLFFVSGGLLGVQDLSRIRNALASHCVGPVGAATCGTLHHLPDSPLPSLLTTKTYYREAEQPSTTWGTASAQPWVGQAANDSMLLLQGPGSGACMQLGINGNRFKVEAATFASNSSNDKLEVGFKVGAAPIAWVSTKVLAKDPNAWKWNQLYSGYLLPGTELCLRIPVSSPSTQYSFIDAAAAAPGD